MTYVALRQFRGGYAGKIMPEVADWANRRTLTSRGVIAEVIDGREQEFISRLSEYRRDYPYDLAPRTPRHAIKAAAVLFRMAAAKRAKTGEPVKQPKQLAMSSVDVPVARVEPEPWSSVHQWERSELYAKDKDELIAIARGMGVHLMPSTHKHSMVRLILEAQAG